MKKVSRSSQSGTCAWSIWDPSPRTGRCSRTTATPEVIDQFRERVLARLVLLPPHDPQFRRNSERVVRDAEREQLALEWVLDWGEEAEG